MKTSQTFFATIGLMIVAASAIADDWPQWRGPDRNGISMETGWITSWPKEGLPVLWKRDMGVGFSSVSVVGNRLYTEGTVGEKQRIYCLDASTGEEIWGYEYEFPVMSGGKRQFWYPGPTSTPTVDGANVYVYTRAGQLFCFEAASGKVVWQIDDTRNKRPPSKYGLSCSPLVVGEQVLVMAGGEGKLLMAFDKKNGKLLWSVGEGIESNASPLVFQHKTGPAVVVLGRTQIIGVSIPNGKVLFKQSVQESPMRDILIVGDKLLAGTKNLSARGKELYCTLYRIPDAPGDLTEIRTYEANLPCLTPPTYQKGFVYNTEGDWGHVTRWKTWEFQCIDFENGKVKWGVKDMCGTATVADGKLLILTLGGVLILAESNPEKYVELARVKVLKNYCLTPPVLANGRIYCRNSWLLGKTPTAENTSWLVCLDVSGKVKPGIPPKIHPRPGTSAAGNPSEITPANAANKTEEH